jgi:cell division protein FtsZ
VLGYDQINGRGFVTPQPAAADAHNRSAYQSRVYEEDQLEIPAFLRRQSS